MVVLVLPAASAATALVAEPANRSLATALPPPLFLLLPSTSPPSETSKSETKKKSRNLKPINAEENEKAQNWFRPVTLALHSLSMALLSATIFAGILSPPPPRSATSAGAPAPSPPPLSGSRSRNKRRRRRSRSRVFWSYIYYLSRFLHALRTFITIFQYRCPLLLQPLQPILILMSFLWLEFSQFFQRSSNTVVTVSSLSLTPSLHHLPHHLHHGVHLPRLAQLSNQSPVAVTIGDASRPPHPFQHLHRFPKLTDF